MEAGVNVQRRAKKVLEERFLKKAKRPGTEEQIEEQLATKVARLPTRGWANIARLRELVTQAKDLWEHRADLKREHVLYLAAGLLYFISPVDAVPDVIPVAGYIDDVFILSWIISMILSALRTLADRVKAAKDAAIEEIVSKGKEAVIEILDRRIEEIDRASTQVVQRSITAVVISLWGATTAAALSMAHTALAGGYPPEWTAYMVISAVFLLLWNAGTAIHYVRGFRRLEGKWQRRIATLVASKVAMRHLVAVGIPLVVIASLVIARLFLVP